MKIINLHKRPAARFFALILAFFTVLCCVPSVAFAAAPLSEVNGSAAILADAETGYILYEQDADEKIYPASTTKVLTAMLVIEAARDGKISLDDELTATQEIIDGVIFDASKVSPNIADTEVMSVREYLYCALLGSDCVACDILANYVAGSVDNFVSLMNERASELGCESTHFANTHGYPDDEHYTTARSLYLIAAQAILYPEFTEIFGTIKYELPATNLSNARMLYNTCWIIWNPQKITSIYCKYYYEYATGGKTGSSNKSGYCLVSTAEKDGKTLLCVVTGAKVVMDSNNEGSFGHFTESTRLFKWGFENFSVHKFANAGEIVSFAPVSNADVDYVDLKLTQDINVFIDNDSKVEELESKVELNRTYLNAPVSAGDVAGTLVISNDKGDIIARAPLVCLNDVAVKEKSSAGVVWFIITVLLIGSLVGLYFYFDKKNPYAVMEIRRKLKLTVQVFFPNAFQDKKDGYKSNARGYYTHSERRRDAPAPKPQSKKKEYYSAGKKK